MNVSELQSFLGSLREPIASSGGKKVADELQRAVEGLGPFATMTIADFGVFLQQAEEYHRTGILPVKASGRKKKAAADPEKISKLAQEVLSLYERAIDESVGYAMIEAEVKKIEKQVTAGEAKELAKEVGISGTPKTKKAAIEEILRKINRRKESFQRTSF